MARRLRRRKRGDEENSRQLNRSAAGTEEELRSEPAGEQPVASESEEAAVEDRVNEGPQEPEDSRKAAEPCTSGDDLSAEYLDQLQRLKAEFDNYRRRVAREKEEWFRLAKAEVMAGLLPVLDDLRRAREHSDGSDEPPDAQGLLLILKRFEDILAQLGLEEQDTRDGHEFDPEIHEAVLTEPSEETSEGRIVRILEPGYSFDGRMLRPGKVSVSSGRLPE